MMLSSVCACRGGSGGGDQRINALDYTTTTVSDGRRFFARGALFSWKNWRGGALSRKIG